MKLYLLMGLLLLLPVVSATLYNGSGLYDWDNTFYDTSSVNYLNSIDQCDNGTIFGVGRTSLGSPQVAIISSHDGGLTWGTRSNYAVSSDNFPMVECFNDHVYITADGLYNFTGTSLTLLNSTTFRNIYEVNNKLFVYNRVNGRLYDITNFSYDQLGGYVGTTDIVGGDMAYFNGRYYINSDGLLVFVYDNVSWSNAGVAGDGGLLVYDDRMVVPNNGSSHYTFNGTEWFSFDLDYVGDPVFIEYPDDDYIIFDQGVTDNIPDWYSYDYNGTNPASMVSSIDTPVSLVGHKIRDALGFIDNGMFNIVAAGNIGSDLSVFTSTFNPVSVLDSYSPIGDFNVSIGDSQLVYFNVSDPLDEVINYYWYVDGDLMSDSDNTFVFTNSTGDYNLTVVAGDSQLNHTFTWFVTVTNFDPVIDSTVPSQSFALRYGEFEDFVVTASDPENQSLLYAWYFNDVLEAETSNTYSFLAVNEYDGSNTLSVVVSDGVNDVSYNWSVEVYGYRGRYDQGDVARVAVDGTVGVIYTWFTLSVVIALALLYFWIGRRRGLI